jgi:cyclopropane-fatty-acyl-phospholipid synthase
MLLLDRMLRRIVRQGELIVVDARGRTYRYGSSRPGQAPVHIRFADKGAPSFIARHPRLGIGEAYMDGRVVIEQGDILALVDLVRSNAPWERGGGIDTSSAARRVRRLFGSVERLNTLARARRNVAHHYDLDDRLYELFLDRDRQYSCAYFEPGNDDLDQAQADKLAHIAAKLALRSGQRVLDVGCGWGGMALYLNRAAGVDVTGVTLSEEQLKVARRRAAAAGVADRVRFELIDYREIVGRFDRIVSVGMFEHVGRPHYRAFFAKCRALLADDGVMLLHTIGRMGKPGTTDPFTAKYIFPGGYNPALSEIVEASQDARLIAADVETLRLHYALTIEAWYARTVAARESIVALYDERFYRMWTFYLAGAISAFRWGGLVNYQIQYIRDRRALPITRSYMIETEAELRAFAEGTGNERLPV